MGWMDNLTRKVNQAESVTGKRISGPAIESAVAGGLATDYEMAFKNAAQERSIRARQTEIKQQNDQFQAQLALDKERLAAQQSQFGQTLAQTQDRMNKEYALGVERNEIAQNAMDKNSVASLSKMGLTNLPTIEKYASKASNAIGSWFEGPNTVGSPDFSVAESAPSLFGAGTTAFGEEAATAAITGMHGLGGGTAEAITQGFGGSLDFATSASEAVGYWSGIGEASTAALVGGLETMSAEAIATWSSQMAFSGAMEAAGIGIGAEMGAMGAGMAVAETGLMSSLTSGISAVSSFCPYIAPVMLGMSFFAPQFMQDLTDMVTDVAEGAWDAVSDVGDAIGDFASGIGDTIGDIFDGGGSIICTELYRQGKLDKRDLVSTNKYRTTIDPDIYQGYLTLFAPIVRLMQRNKYFNYFAAWLFKGFAQEMVHRMRPSQKPSIRGKLLIGFFSPICKTITVIKERKESLYERFGYSRWSRSGL